MNLDYFFEQVYYYYPKNISSITNSNEYINSKEYKRLSLKLKGEDYKKKDIEKLKKNIEVIHKTKIFDYTIPTWEDRCLNLQFLLKTENSIEKKTILCINISKLIPFFVIYILEVEFDEIQNRLKYLPRRNYNKEKFDFKKNVESVKQIVYSNLNSHNEFPSELLYRKLENVNFQDIKMGDFTFFNAFFLNFHTTQFA